MHLHRRKPGMAKPGSEALDDDDDIEDDDDDIEDDDDDDYDDDDLLELL